MAPIVCKNKYIYIVMEVLSTLTDYINKLE